MRKLEVESTDVNNLTTNDMTKLYKYLIEFELNIRSQYGSYNFDNISLKEFLNKYQFNLAHRSKLSQEQVDKFFFQENTVIFDATKPKDKENDFAHHLLRHLRNAISHALIERDGMNYQFSDKNQNGKITAKGIIKCEHFFDLIEMLTKT